ncbi:MAG TPA: hypothetical protein VIT23_08105, partial [Terrimicrobiaceae bacterium]
LGLAQSDLTLQLDRIDDGHGLSGIEVLSNLLNLFELDFKIAEITRLNEISRLVELCIEIGYFLFQRSLQSEDRGVQFARRERLL